MTADAGAVRSAAVVPGIPLRRRLFGLGSVFGKTIRDLRLAALAIGLVAGLLMLIGGGLVAAQFPTAASRLELTALSTSLPAVMAGLLGDPVNVDKLGGFLSWRIGSTIPVLFSIWSIMVLSGTLAGEASRGALEVVLAASLSRGQLALQKVGAFVLALAVAMAIAAGLTWLTGVLFAALPGDEVKLEAALGQFALYGAEILAAGALAFALGPFIGRGAAAGIAGTILFAGYLVDGFSTIVPIFASVEPLSWFAWTAGHRPLAGSWDWAPVGILVLLSFVLLAIGIAAFDRRDLASTIRLPFPGFPRATLGTRGPLGRSFGDRLPAALAWGLGTALIGVVFAVASTSFSEAMSKIPAFRQLLDLLYPGIDHASPGGFLQIAVFGSGAVLFGLAAATAVSGWASDESTGRLEAVLATPIRRARWVIESGLGAMGVAPLVALLMGAGVAAGALQAGGDAATPAIGTAVLAVYMLALIGLGIAVAGLIRPGLAAPTVVILTVAFYLIQVFGTALNLPAWFVALSLNEHLGQPMVGRVDVPGLVLCAGLAFGGLLAGTWGMVRRDLRG